MSIDVDRTFFDVSPPQSAPPAATPLADLIRAFRDDEEFAVNEENLLAHWEPVEQEP